MRVRGFKKEFWDTLDLKEQIEFITVILICLVLLIGIVLGAILIGNDSSIQTMAGLGRLGVS